jgi:hypothetical protein
VLYKLIKQLQNVPKGEKRQLPGSFLNVLGVSRPRNLGFSDPGVQWISFLLRDGRGTLAVRVFSIFLHRGYHFSPRAIKHLCEDASLLNSPQPVTVFAEYISTALSRHRKGAISIIETLIQTFCLHGKHEAVLALGSLVLVKDGLATELPHYRRILQSMFKVHGVSRKTHPEDNTSAVIALLSFLGDWLQALHRDRHKLDQINITILLQRLFSLLQRQHRRERPLPWAIRLWVISLVEKLSLHLSDPMSKLVFAEKYLDGLERPLQQGGSSSARHCKAPSPTQIYSDVIRWTNEWVHTILKREQSLTTDRPCLEQLTTKSRVLKILVRDRVIAGDDTAALEHMREIASFQMAFSRLLPKIAESSRSPSNVAADLPVRQYVQDAHLRYVSTMVWVCSYYLRKQELPTIFLVLPFTIHINDLGTFVRLWKRALCLVIKKGSWGGAVGLDALLTLLAQSTPPLWEKTVVGRLLFTSPALLEATLRVALDKFSQQEQTAEGRRAEETAKLIALARENPQAFHRWEVAMFPFIGPLRSPWRDVLRQERGGNSDEKIRLERVLWGKMILNSKTDA